MINQGSPLLPIGISLKLDQCRTAGGSSPTTMFTLWILFLAWAPEKLRGLSVQGRICLFSGILALTCPRVCRIAGCAVDRVGPQHKGVYWTREGNTEKKVVLESEQAATRQLRCKARAVRHCPRHSLTGRQRLKQLCAWSISTRSLKQTIAKPYSLICIISATHTNKINTFNTHIQADTQLGWDTCTLNRLR